MPFLFVCFDYEMHGKYALFYVNNTFICYTDSFFMNHISHAPQIQKKKTKGMGWRGSAQCKSPGGGGFSLYPVYAGVPFWRVSLRRCCLTYRSTLEILPYKRVPFCSKLRFHPLKMHVSLTATISESLLIHIFWGHFCPLFLEFALQRVKFSALTRLIEVWGFKSQNGTPTYKNRGRAPPGCKSTILLPLHALAPTIFKDELINP